MDRATRKGAVLSDGGLKRFLDDHAVVLVELGAGNAYRVRTTRPITTTFAWS
ncbi:MAG: hypothetical protein QOH08_733 [Chloroflexota bacterium]|jgi:hypothetical protein|nr:hypothetical protein [Chloroflexota bacterium]